jgi:hypothetical protein
MSNRLRVALPSQWRDYSHINPDGPPTYYREDNEQQNALQMSWAWYKGGKEPHPTDEALIQLASGAFAEVEGFSLISTACGPCKIGRFGTAISRSREFPRLQAWHLSNGLDFVMVTYICGVDPTDAEMSEVQEIVEALAITVEE